MKTRKQQLRTIFLVTIILFLSSLNYTYADFGVNASEYDVSWIQPRNPLEEELFVRILPDHAYTKFEVYKGSQFKGWNDRDIGGNPLGGTLEGIDPDKDYVVVEWEYDFGVQTFPTYHERDVEPIFAIVDPESLKVLYYGSYWHYMPMLFEPVRSDPAELSSDPYFLRVTNV